MHNRLNARGRNKVLWAFPICTISFIFASTLGAETIRESALAELESSIGLLLTVEASPSVATINYGEDKIARFEWFNSPSCSGSVDAYKKLSVPLEILDLTKARWSTNTNYRVDMVHIPYVDEYENPERELNRQILYLIDITPSPTPENSVVRLELLNGQIANLVKNSEVLGTEYSQSCDGVNRLRPLPTRAVTFGVQINTAEQFVEYLSELKQLTSRD